MTHTSCVVRHCVYQDCSKAGVSGDWLQRKRRSDTAYLRSNPRPPSVTRRPVQSLTTWQKETRDKSEEEVRKDQDRETRSAPAGVLNHNRPRHTLNPMITFMLSTNDQWLSSIPAGGGWRKAVLCFSMSDFQLFSFSEFSLNLFPRHLFACVCVSVALFHKLVFMSQKVG